MHPDTLKEKRAQWGREYRKMRIEKKLSQERLAQLSGLSRTTISIIETGYKSVLSDCLIIYRETITNCQTC